MAGQPRTVRGMRAPGLPVRRSNRQNLTVRFCKFSEEGKAPELDPIDWPATEVVRKNALKKYCYPAHPAAPLIGLNSAKVGGEKGRKNITN